MRPNDYGRLIYACEWERVKTGDTVASYAISDNGKAKKGIAGYDAAGGLGGPGARSASLSLSLSLLS
jgi:hypothetical protein